jgi:hypothetical protein
VIASCALARVEAGLDANAAPGEPGRAFICECHARVSEHEQVDFATIAEAALMTDEKKDLRGQRRRTSETASFIHASSTYM